MLYKWKRQSMCSTLFKPAFGISAQQTWHFPLVFHSWHVRNLEKSPPWWTSGDCLVSCLISNINTLQNDFMTVLIALEQIFSVQAHFQKNLLLTTIKGPLLWTIGLFAIDSGLFTHDGTFYHWKNTRWQSDKWWIRLNDCRMLTVKRSTIYHVPPLTSK